MAEAEQVAACIYNQNKFVCPFGLDCAYHHTYVDRESLKWADFSTSQHLAMVAALTTYERWEGVSPVAQFLDHNVRLCNSLIGIDGFYIEPKKRGGAKTRASSCPKEKIGNLDPAVTIVQHSKSRELIAQKYPSTIIARSASTVVQPLNTTEISPDSVTVTQQRGLTKSTGKKKKYFRNRNKNKQSRKKTQASMDLNQRILQIHSINPPIPLPSTGHSQRQVPFDTDHTIKDWQLQLKRLTCNIPKVKPASDFTSIAPQRIK